MTIYAIDPGPHTGIFYDGSCSLTLDFTDKHITDGQLRLYMWLMQMVDPERDFVICESFEFRKDDARERSYIDYSTGEYVGVVKLFCQITHTKHVMQTAAQAKGFWNDDKLKRVGIYKLLKTKHERDAARHWLHYDAFNLKNTYYLNKLK